MSKRQIKMVYIFFILINSSNMKKNNKKISTEYLLEMTRFVLKNNYFEFYSMINPNLDLPLSMGAFFLTPVSFLLIT